MRDITGSKYKETENLSLKEIAKLIRADFKELKLKGYKISVRCRDHIAIDMEVVAVPEGFRMFSDIGAEFTKKFPNRPTSIISNSLYSDDYTKIVAEMKKIFDSYNYDYSDVMSDFFNVRYYGNPKLSYDLRSQLEKNEVAASATDLLGENF